MNNLKHGYWSKSRFLITLLSIGIITACEPIQAQQLSSPNLPTTGASSQKLTDQNLLRSYYIYIPSSYNSNHPMPLVLVFHGDDGTGRSISNVSEFNKLAEQKGFIVVYPDGLDNNWRLKQQNSKGIDDITFVNHLIDNLQNNLNIDGNRIYATGFSKGGIFAQVLACTLSDKIAAFASVAGALPVQREKQCQPQTPVSMLMINGTNDKSVHYQGDEPSQKGALVSIPETVNFWREQNQCQGSLKNVAFEPNESSDTTVKTVAYNNCVSGSEVLHLAVINGGHQWYGGASTDENVNKFNQKLGLNSTETIWNFFTRHSLGQ